MKSARNSSKLQAAGRLVAAFCLFFLLNAPSASGQSQDGGLRSFRDDLDRESLRAAVERSLEFVGKLPPDRVVGEYPRRLTAGEVKDSLLSFLELLPLWDRPESFFKELRSRFDLLPSADGSGAEILLTGYYLPVIEGSLTESEEYRFPIYGRPKDLVTAQLVTLAPVPRTERIVGRLDEERFEPYLTRHEIDVLGKLKGRGDEIAWAKDPVDLFFLHIQGSGLLRLADGRLLHLNYAASNGRPYRSIGKALIDSGKVPENEMTMQRLLRYVRERPEERDALFSQNERYIFFRIDQEGPFGSLGVPLTAGRSIATDLSLFPKGALALARSHKPVLSSTGKIVGWRSFSRFVMNQDTGSAIRGPRRADLYFGAGVRAGLAAGAMHNKARLYFLIKKAGP